MQISITEQSRLFIQGAMDSEIGLLIRSLSRPSTTRIAGFPFCEGYYKGLPVTVMKTYQGMANAAAATMLAIHMYAPAAIINQGVCGGHDLRLHQGDIILGEKIIHYGNLKIGVSKTDNPLDGCRIIGCELIQTEPDCAGAENGQSIKSDAFYSDPDLLRCAKAVQFAQPGVSVLSGTIGSADSWIDHPVYMRQISQALGTLGEDMESAAAAQLCTSFRIPFLSVRALSNSLLQNEAFDESTTQISQKFILQMLEQLI